jgi:hypothetical protein
MLPPVLRRSLLGASLLLPLLGVDRFLSPAQAAPRTSPLRVPLQWAQDVSNPSILKLGIQASLNGGSPRLFEFDTGGTGFFATFADATASLSPWWGSAPTCTASPCPTFSTTYDSGLTYTGNLVSGSVSLFAGASSAAPLLTVPNLSVGQTTAILCNPNATCGGKTTATGASSWEASTGQANPPVQGNFYGDFGLSLRNGGAGGPNILITQDAFWAAFDPAITRGYRVHAAAGSLQVSLGSTQFSDTSNLTTLIFDTGATTTIHTGTLTINGVPFPSPGNFPCSLTSLGCPFPTTQPNSSVTPPPPFNATSVLGGAQVQVSGLSLSTGQSATLLDFTAGNNKATTPAFNEVAVQGYSTDPSDLAPACAALPSPQPCYYVNTGILPFLSHDVIVNLSSWSATTPAGELTLVPQVPVPPALLAPWAAFASARRLRRRRGPQAPAQRSA